MLSVLVLLLVVAAASFAYRAFWMLRARPSSRYVGSRFRDEVVWPRWCWSACWWAAWAARCDRPSSFRFRPVGVSGGLSSCVWA
mgnify:CR=1 FL=1